MNQKVMIESIVKEHGFTEFKWIDSRDIHVAQWVRVKCQFGCSDYGSGTCPPNTPSVEECQKFFNEYHHAIIIKLTIAADKDQYPTDWSKQMTSNLLSAERKIFLSGFHKVFLLNQSCCCNCTNCSGDRLHCVDKKNSRPSPEGFAVDVYQTCQNVAMEIKVVDKNPSNISRIALLLIE
jgi:predicted metal-binding protein